MVIASVRCPVARATVTRVTDFEGATTRVICPEYEEPTGICRLKEIALAGGPLSRFLERVSEGTLNRRAMRCDIH